MGPSYGHLKLLQSFGNSACSFSIKSLYLETANVYYPYCLLCILFSFFWRLPEELHRRASGGVSPSYSGTFWSHFQANLRAKTYQNVSQTDVRNRRSEQPHKKDFFLAAQNARKLHLVQVVPFHSSKKAFIWERFSYAEPWGATSE